MSLFSFSFEHSSCHEMLWQILACYAIKLISSVKQQQKGTHNFQVRHLCCVEYKLKCYIKYIQYSHTQLHILLDYIRL